MLKFLTHKLKTQSINEENQAVKADEDHDSGTESDEEVEAPELRLPVSDRVCSVSPADTGCSMESPGPDQHDPHSSEEELEVINSNSRIEKPPIPLRAASVCLAEKRKWSQVGDVQSRRYSPENEENISHFGNLSPSSSCSPNLKSYGEEGVHIEHSGSSDDEVHHLLNPRATPVQFRTSPPLEAVKPERRCFLHKGGSMSPPPKLLHYEACPRKRTKHTRHAHIQRPYLDFEKMQQLKTRSVTAWRHTGDHAGELSVFCW
ncbi:hypothetical protein JTB14_001622 [Gonioctena quinquepunctata]|nr:hypothetical protein JTB14_001622 [Gonioctena quinquepunctata]